MAEKHTELLPCPFCTGPADFIGSEHEGYRVECKHCGSQSGWGDYGFQVEAMWNRRPPLIAQAPAMLEALRKIAAEDDTGPLVFEVDDTGRSWPSHNAPGKFAEIANAVIAAATGEAP